MKEILNRQMTMEWFIIWFLICGTHLEFWRFRNLASFCRLDKKREHLIIVLGTKVLCTLHKNKCIRVYKEWIGVNGECLFSFITFLSMSVFGRLVTSALLTIFHSVGMWPCLCIWVRDPWHSIPWMNIFSNHQWINPRYFLEY